MINSELSSHASKAPQYYTAKRILTIMRSMMTSTYIEKWFPKNHEIIRQH